LCFVTIRIAINPIKTQQFILLFSTICCDLEGQHGIEYKNKSVKK